MNGRRQELGRDVLALGRVQLEAPVVQAFLKACEQGLCGVVRTSNGPFVRVEGSRVHRAVDGFGLCSTL